LTIIRFMVRYRYIVGIIILMLLIPFTTTYVRGWFLVDRLNQPLNGKGAVLQDRNGAVITRLGGINQTYIPLDRIPDHMQQAIIAIEDRRFYRHPGIDPLAIIRALYVNLRSGGAARQGGSTITQQLAKNAFLTPRKSLARKLEEAVLALVLEDRLSKQRILELYLNRVYYGEGAYGIGQASQTYFRKSPDQLSLPESALLAALPRAPSLTSPYKNPNLALARRNAVLDAMAELGFITAETAQTAKKSLLKLNPNPGGRAPYFTDYITDQLVKDFGERLLFETEMRIRTSLDLKMQAAAQEALGDTQGAIVALDPANGYIRALVGGRNYRESQFNRATQALRQPGSAIKPFVYVTALKQGWTMATIVNDIPQRVSDYQPGNFSGAYWGPVTMKHAIVQSLNNAAVWTMRQVGVDAVIDTLTSFGVTTLVPGDENLALALGGMTRGTTLLELTAAYLPFANGGYSILPSAVISVRDENGKLRYQAQPEKKRVISPQIAYLMTDILSKVIERGTGENADIGRPAAGKTGTTDKGVSLWFVGYTPDLVAGVYVGNDDSSPTYLSGGAVAAPVWARFMKKALSDLPARAFTQPERITTGITIDVFTGRPATAASKLTEVDSFLAGTEPTPPQPVRFGARPELTNPRPRPLPSQPGRPPAPPQPETPAPAQPEPQVPEPPAPEEQPPSPQEPSPPPQEPPPEKPPQEKPEEPRAPEQTPTVPQTPPPADE